jgi:dihydroorotate dehydrogenase electron transfer subunit
MRLVSAELVESREILPNQWLQAYHAPSLASGARAGQFVHVRTGDYSGLVLRRPFSINTADPLTGVVTIHFRVVGRGTEWFTRLRPGDPVDMLGPLGRPFAVDPRSRHLLLVAGGLGIAGVRMLVDEALQDGRQVTLLFGAATAREVYPSSLLPDEVEYAVATDDGSLGLHGLVTELVPEYEAWADQAFACGPQPMLAALSRLAATRRQRLGVASLGRKRGAGRTAPAGSAEARRKAYLQVALEQHMGCAVGACLGCVVMGTAGSPLRVCREGPVFASDEIAWEGGWMTGVAAAG